MSYWIKHYTQNTALDIYICNVKHTTAQQPISWLLQHLIKFISVFSRFIS